MRSTAVRRSITAVAGFLLLTLSACTVPGFGPDPEEAVDQLADALSSGDVKSVDFAKDDAAARTAYKAITDGMGKAKVSAGEVSTEGDSATGRLDWSWKVGSQTWSYKTEVQLTKGKTDDGDAWLVRWNPTLVQSSLKPGERLVETAIKPERGDILGADDKPIVTQRPVLRVGIDKSTLEGDEAKRSASSLAQLVDVDAKAFVKQVTAAGPKAFVQAIVYRRNDVPPNVLGGLSDIKGARAISDRLPLAPSKDFASAILGTVGPATAELVKDSDGRIKAGDDVGLSGLQKRYDEQLVGTRGATVVAVNEEGERRTLFTAEPEPGKPLRTTIDPAIQQTAQQVLADVPSGSALVAIRPSTGELVAVASGPGSKGYNTATYGRYAPGSTFKVVSALALLRAGVTPGTRGALPGHDLGRRQELQELRRLPGLGPRRDHLRGRTRQLVQHGVHLPAGQARQAVAGAGRGVAGPRGRPRPRLPGVLRRGGRAGSETQAAASMIGQGSVLASPMAMATVVASVLEGKTVLPKLLPDTDVQQKKPAKPLTSGEAEQLRSMMRAVVERGSGEVLGDLPGGPVIAKTGTAEFGEQPPLPTHAWMVAGRDDLAVAVFVERGDSGSGTAGPILHDFLERVR